VGLLRSQRDDGFVETAPDFERCDPTAGEIRASRQWPHDRAGPLNQYGPNVHIAALGDAAQSSRAATRMLPGHQAQPRRKLSLVLERTGIANRLHQGRRGTGPTPGACISRCAGSVCRASWSTR